VKLSVSIESMMCVQQILRVRPTGQSIKKNVENVEVRLKPLCNGR